MSQCWGQSVQLPSLQCWSFLLLPHWQVNVRRSRLEAPSVCYIGERCTFSIHPALGIASESFLIMARAAKTNSSSSIAHSTRFSVFPDDPLTYHWEIPLSFPDDTYTLTFLSPGFVDFPRASASAVLNITFPYYFNVGAWGACTLADTATTGLLEPCGIGYRRRELLCSDANGDSAGLSNCFRYHTAPPVEEACSIPCDKPTYIVSSWTSCSRYVYCAHACVSCSPEASHAWLCRYCDGGVQYRNLSCLDPEDVLIELFECSIASGMDPFPVLERPCNQQPCAPELQLQSWSMCDFWECKVPGRQWRFPSCQNSEQ